MRRFQYVFEPIVSIDQATEPKNGQPEISEYELLCKSKPATHDISGWLAWYEKLGDPIMTATQSLRANLVSVNLTSDQILNPEIADRIASLRGMPLAIEWTEQIHVDSLVRDAGAVLCEWRQAYGFDVHIDDVGSGQSGFLRMSLTDATRVKLDGEVFQSWRKSGTKRQLQLLRRLVEMYLSLDIQVVCEWIETPADLMFALELGVTHVQGYMWKHKEIGGIV